MTMLDHVCLYIATPGMTEVRLFCGTENYRYSAPLTWYLTSNEVENYDLCEDCLATDEFAMAVLADIGE